MEEFGRDCCICGYHVYKEMWEAAAGEVLEGMSCTTFKIDMPWLLKYHGTFTTKSVFLQWGVRYPVQWQGEKILRRSVNRVELTFVYWAQKCMCYIRTINYHCFKYCLLAHENILTMKFPKLRYIRTYIQAQHEIKTSYTCTIMCLTLRRLAITLNESHCPVLPSWINGPDNSLGWKQ